MRRWLWLGLALALAAAAPPPRAPAPGPGHAVDPEPLTADLSSHVIGINTGFTGASLILFGAKEQPGDIIVVVRGPPSVAVLRRKHRVLGIWINTEGLTLDDTPAYYAMASSRPLDEIATPALLRLHQVGLGNIRPVIAAATDVTPDQEAEFRKALVRQQELNARYVEEVGKVAFLGEHLFRVTIGFPASVPFGHYAVETFLVRDKKIVAGQTVPLLVTESGVNAEIHEFARTQSLAYGLIAVAAAAMAGWLASVAFRQR
jgi:uncharacterized protein (TIGR02186 family)